MLSSEDSNESDACYTQMQSTGYSNAWYQMFVKHKILSTEDSKYMISVVFYTLILSTEDSTDRCSYIDY